MWAIPTGTSSSFKKKSDKESQYMVSHPELGSDPPIGSDRESGCEKPSRPSRAPTGRPRSQAARVYMVTQQAADAVTPRNIP